MTRLTRAQFASLKLLITALIAADLFAIWVWATRPPRIYSDWLGLTGFGSDAPFLRLVILESAVKWQEKALALTREPAGVQSCQKRLALYVAGKAYRSDGD
jgi:hypothetical protein